MGFTVLVEDFKGKAANVEFGREFTVSSSNDIIKAVRILKLSDLYAFCTELQTIEVPSPCLQVYFSCYV